MILSWNWSLDKTKKVIEEFVDSKYFVDDEGNFDYPINWKDTKIYTYDELDSGQSSDGKSLNYNTMTYSAPKNAANPNGIFSENTRNFAKKMITFSDYWIQTQQPMLGLNHQINFFSIWVIYVDPDDPCYSIVLTYPGV